MMKKILALVLIIAVVALIAGCGKEETPESQAAAEKTTTETSADEVSAGLEDVDALNEDLDTSELDDLDQELENVSW